MVDLSAVKKIHKCGYKGSHVCLVHDCGYEIHEVHECGYDGSGVWLVLECIIKVLVCVKVHECGWFLSALLKFMSVVGS